MSSLKFLLATAALVACINFGQVHTAKLSSSNVFPVPVDPAIEYGNANFYIDLVLYNVNKQLPDSIYLGDLGGPYKLTECTFYGTEYGIRREGDATLVTTGDIIQCASDFKMQDIGIQCTWHQVGLHGQCTGGSPHVTIASGMAIKLDHGQHPYLTDFRVTEMDDIKVDIHGLTPAFNWLAEDIANWMISKAQDELTLVIETVVREVMQDILNTMVIP